MSSLALGRRYAKALIGLAEEAGSVDAVGQELRAFCAVWNESKELRELFENPAIPADASRQVLAKLAERLRLSGPVRNALFILADRKRLRFVPEVTEAFQNLSEARGGQVRATVTTATELPESFFGRLRRTLHEATGKEVVLTQRVDPSLVAGVVAQVGGKVFDGSVRNRLQEMKEELRAL